ncbi:hypothetical protein KM427_24925 [Nocardioides sp. LMS-CY]|uniref:Uncharacterized protein n=1 Tax=Nocardioides soli TaxID=1036020 RepID=A0A7W4W0T4_9ACTN|nr:MULTISPECIES: hypothetical protein [Nocardioides]MBB3045383.1 hypothetical protein [Nocardioides soli]QWF22097.1 hypothetical protein KM427_24925 [Nocardioides sp. LMS-CY]
MNPLSVNPAIALDHALRAESVDRAARSRRTRRVLHAARTARVALERVER